MCKAKSVFSDGNQSVAGDSKVQVDVDLVVDERLLEHLCRSRRW